MPIVLLLVGFVHAQAGPDTPAATAGQAPASAPSGGRSGIVVRLDAGGTALTAPVVVGLDSPTAGLLTIPLNDEGQSPDVTAGDGTWSGAGMAGGDTATVTLTSGTLTLAGGQMSLGSGSARDLGLRLDGGVLTQVDAGASPPPLGDATVVGAPTPGQPVDPASAPLSGGPGPAPPQGPSDARSDALLYVAFGVGGLLLAAVGYFWLRGPSGSGSLPRGVTVVPEPGLFGPASPPLAPGLTQWILPEGDIPWALGSMLATLGQWRPVLVCAPAETSIPNVPGGPIFRVSPKKGAGLVDAADGLVDAHPRLVVVVVGEPGGPGTLHRWVRDLTSDLPVLAVLSAPVDGGGTIVRGVIEGGRLRGDVA